MAAEGQSFVSPQDHYETRAPGGWTALREAGAVVFTAPASAGSAWHPGTVFIQSAAIEGDWVPKRTPELVIAATERALRHLPQARVNGPAATSAAGMHGALFELSYVPASARGRRYERKHVVLFGQRHLFHVVATAPQGNLPSTVAAFDTILKNLHEEG